jgi:hypothetical protein
MNEVRAFEIGGEANNIEGARFNLRHFGFLFSEER